MKLTRVFKGVFTVVEAYLHNFYIINRKNTLEKPANHQPSLWPWKIAVMREYSVYEHGPQIHVLLMLYLHTVSSGNALSTGLWLNLANCILQHILITISYRVTLLGVLLRRRRRLSLLTSVFTPSFSLFYTPVNTRLILYITSPA